MIFSVKAMTLASSLSLAVMAIAPSHAAEEASEEHEHHHESHATSELSLNAGKKWQTDAPLRESMQSINDAVLNAVPAFEDKTLTKQDAEKLAKHIDEQVAFIVDNCKLEAEADAVLHLLIGELLSGASALAVDPLSKKGLPDIVRALLAYPLYFDHPDWGK
jgi:hypothetical protein